MLIFFLDFLSSSKFLLRLGWLAGMGDGGQGWGGEFGSSKLSNHDSSLSGGSL